MPARPARSVRAIARRGRRSVRRAGFWLRDRVETSGDDWQLDAVGRALAGEARGWPLVGSVAAGLLGRASGVALALRHRDAALRLSARAATAAPTSADPWLRLSEALRAADGGRPAADEVRGLIAGGTGRAEAIEAATRATELAPHDPATWMELGSAADLAGDLAMSRRAFEAATALEPGLADAWYRLGRTSAGVATRRGTFVADDVRHHADSLRRTLQLDPDHLHARYHLARVAVRAQDWATAIDAADPSGRATAVGLGDLVRHGTDPDRLRAVLDEHAEAADPALVDAWLVAHWRAFADGHLGLAFEAKDAYARCLLALLAPGSAISATKARVRALACLGDVDGALEELDALDSSPGDRHHRAVTGKLRHDLDVLRGGRSGFVRPVDPGLGIAADGPSRRRFDELVRGRRVAVVGPVELAEPPGALDDADVVITTLSTGLAPPSTAAARRAGRPLVAYVANSSVARFPDRLARLLDDDPGAMLVLRPTSRPVTPDELGDRDDVRWCPTENAALLEATPYAVPRILYDVLHHQPASVSLHHVDLFARGRRYAPGYRRRPATRDGDDIVENLDGYGHDLRADFRWVRDLASAGVVEVSDGLAEILARSELAYLDGAGRSQRDAVGLS